MSTIIDQPFAAVNQILLPHLLKSLISTLNYLFVQGEDEILPITTNTQTPDLAFHIALILKHEIIDLLIEFFARKIETGLTFGIKVFLVNSPGFETGVVGAGN